MKKTAKIIGLTFASLLVLILAAAVIIPIAFKDKIKVRVEEQINSTVNAKVFFADYKLSLLKAFPNATFSLHDLCVTGIERFGGDTLTSVKSFDIIFNLMSIFSDKGYEVKSIIIDRPQVNAIVLEDGTANWDIMKAGTTDTTKGEGEAEAEVEVEVEPSSMKLLLRKVAVHDGHINYNDLESDMAASVNGLMFTLSGDMHASQTDLMVDLAMQSVTFVMEKVRYLSGATASLHGEIDSQLDSMIFRFKDNSIKINDISLTCSGLVAMPGDDISTDLVFKTQETSFKSLLSMIPAVYMEGYESLKASGTFSLDGNITGVYSSADSTMPDIKFRLLVNDGVVSYPDLPEKITAIGIDAVVDMDGTDMDRTTLDVNRFHFELAGNPFDMSFNLATPISDPAISAKAIGKIDLTKLQQAIPLDSVSLSGLIDLSLSLAGRMSMIEQGKYDQFRADGFIGIANMAMEMPDLPAVKIDEASFTFNPAFSELKQLKMKVGEKSDFTVSGRLENYIPYLFSDSMISGKLALSSAVVDLNEIMDKIPSDTTSVEDTTALAVISIPQNIDFNFTAVIGKLIYDKLVATDVHGNIIIHDGVVTIRETGMKAMGGSLVMNADYDTRDTLKPVVRADMKISAINIKDAFSTFNTVQKLAPAAKGLGGNISVAMKYESLLGTNMMPLISTITGAGEVKSEMVQILESKSFDQMKGVLKLNPAYTNTIKDLRAAFSIKNGRLYVKPFDTKLGNIKMNVAGDQGLDQTINYVVKTEISRSDLGESVNALIGSLSAQALLLGVNYVPSDIIKVSLKVGGTFTKPVITPVFTGGESGGAVSSATTALKEQATEKVNETAREQADKILKEAEEKAQLMRDEAASAAKTIRIEADLQAQKLVKEAESKGTIVVIAAKKGADALRKEADKRATQLETETNTKADQLLAEAKVKADEFLK